MGAGASVPYGKPTTKQFKELLSEKYKLHNNLEYLRDFLRNDNFKDIEHVLQSIKEIRNFLNGYGGLFFTGNSSPLHIRFQGNMKNFDIDFFKEEMEGVEKVIQKEIFEHYRWNDKSNKVLLKIFNTLFALFEPKNGIHIFTTNYDNAVETYCDLTQKHKPIDGFKLNVRGRTWEWKNDFSPPDLDEGIDVFLHKLHGSLDWKQQASGKIVKTHEESQPTDPRYQSNSLIYPTLSPKEDESTEPYKTIIEKFNVFMKTVNFCIVIGYSFRDHLNHSFMDMLERGHTKLIVISPTAITDLYEHLLKENIPEDKKENFEKSIIFTKDHISRSGNKSRIHCIQKPLDQDTIDEIQKDITRIIETDEYNL